MNLKENLMPQQKKHSNDLVRDRMRVYWERLKKVQSKIRSHQVLRIQSEVPSSSGVDGVVSVSCLVYVTFMAVGTQGSTWLVLRQLDPFSRQDCQKHECFRVAIFPVFSVKTLCSCPVPLTVAILSGISSLLIAPSCTQKKVLRKWTHLPSESSASLERLLLQNWNSSSAFVINARLAFTAASCSWFDDDTLPVWWSLSMSWSEVASFGREVVFVIWLRNGIKAPFGLILRSASVAELNFFLDF